MRRSQEIEAMVVGAVIGSVAGYLLLTDRGRRARQQFRPALEDVAREFLSVRDAVRELADAANEGRQLWNDTFGERLRTRYPSAQSAPF